MATLMPELFGDRLTVSMAMSNPSYIMTRISDVADKTLILDSFFSPYGGTVQGGAILYNVLAAKDRYLNGDVAERKEGAEYAVVEGTDPEARLAPVRDWGGKFATSDEQIHRNDVSYLTIQVDQLANTIARKLNVAALATLDAELDALGGAADIVGHNWDDVVTTGPESTLTPNRERPAADFALAQLSADGDELGIKFDTLLVHPEQAFALTVAYAENLTTVLNSAGLTMKSSPYITPGKAYITRSGAAGTVGFEKPLTVDVYDDRSIRSKWTQAYAVPAYAVEQPRAVRRILGLAA
ncbi:major capsid protein [Antrihabitans spumae]|uniref:Major capsid protein n=1 Tax=Antrihabitans spumae TaxID=3373370 RepID=A0ABW7KB69_9NOCA